MPQNQNKKCRLGLCDGWGKIATDVFDPDSGQMMHGVGEEICPCQDKEDDEYEPEQ